MERFQALRAEEQERVRMHPQLRFRIELTDFITVSARQYDSDLPVGTAVGVFYEVYFLLRDRTHLRTNTDFERRCIASLYELHPLVDGYAERHPDADVLDVDDAMRDLFVSIPLRLVLGESRPAGNFDLICWNGAHALVEGIRLPFWAAFPIVHAAYHRPADPYGIVPPLTTLTERYVDHPDDRDAVADDIAAVLTRFLEVAPWPRGGRVNGWVPRSGRRSGRRSPRNAAAARTTAPGRTPPAAPGHG
jgi:hypothetical protein